MTALKAAPVPEPSLLQNEPLREEMESTEIIHANPLSVAAGQEATRAATPIVTRCDMIWPEHAQASTNDQYMFLRDILVAPVWNTSVNLTSRTVFLPPGTWEDGWSGESTTGPQTISIEQPYERIPMWHRKGGLVISDNTPAALRVDDQDWSELTLEAWPMAGAEAVTRPLYERGSRARTNITLCFTRGMVRIDVEPESNATARSWLLRLHLVPGQRILSTAAALVDGSATAAKVLMARAADSPAHFPLLGEGALPPHRAGPIVEVRVPSGRGSRMITVATETDTSDARH